MHSQLTRVSAFLGAFAIAAFSLVAVARAQRRPDDIVKTDPAAAAQMEARLLGPAFKVSLDVCRVG
jgi:hypothetical protein